MVKMEERYANRMVYNLTAKVITCYNSEGFFVELKPVQNNRLPGYRHGVCYVVTEDVYNAAKSSGRETKDLIHIMTSKANDIGRAGTRIDYLETYDEFSGGEFYITPCSRRMFRSNDPEEKTYHFLSV